MASMPGALGGGHQRHAHGRPQPNPQNQVLIDQARRTNLVDLVGRYTQLRRKAVGEFEGPCPKCGGSDRFTVDGHGWFCRSCHPYDEAHGWYGPIDFVMWTTGLDFKGAIGFLTGAQMIQGIQQRQPEPKQQRPPQTDEWRAEGDAIVTAAQQALAVDGNVGAAYLERRGLQPATWQAFGMGFGAHKDKPAIVLPWYRAGKLVAIRYRYLQPEPGGEKIISRFDSRFGGVFYGGQALFGCGESARTLILCEGELNAASIWQVAHEWGVDVLSLGSESATLTQPMIDYAGQFRSVIVWMDKLEVAKKLTEKMTGSLAVSSPTSEAYPKGEDANDMLRNGKLGAFIALARAKACRNDQEREGVLWDIWDAANVPAGVDGGAARIAIKLATQLGKTVNLAECEDKQWRVQE